MYTIDIHIFHESKVNVQSLPVGSLFLCKEQDSPTYNHVLLSCQKGVVSLTNPALYWPDDTCYSLWLFGQCLPDNVKITISD